MSDKVKFDGSIEELTSELRDCQDALQNLVFQKTMQQLEDLSLIRKTRRKIARLKTYIHDRKILDNNKV